MFPFLLPGRWWTLLFVFVRPIRATRLRHNQMRLKRLLLVRYRRRRLMVMRRMLLRLFVGRFGRWGLLRRMIAGVRTRGQSGRRGLLMRRPFWRSPFRAILVNRMLRWSFGGRMIFTIFRRRRLFRAKMVVRLTMVLLLFITLFLLRRRRIVMVVVMRLMVFPLLFRVRVTVTLRCALLLVLRLWLSVFTRVFALVRCLRILRSYPQRRTVTNHKKIHAFIMGHIFSR